MPGHSKLLIGLLRVDTISYFYPDLKATFLALNINDRLTANEQQVM